MRAQSDPIPCGNDLLIVGSAMNLSSWHQPAGRKWMYLPRLGFPGGTSGKEPPCQRRRHKRLRFNPWVRKIPWRRKWQFTPVFLPGESHGHRGAGRATVHGFTKSWTQLKRLSPYISIILKNLTFTLIFCCC